MVLTVWWLCLTGHPLICLRQYLISWYLSLCLLGGLTCVWCRYWCFFLEYWCGSCETNALVSSHWEFFFFDFNLCNQSCCIGLYSYKRTCISILKFIIDLFFSPVHAGWNFGLCFWSCILFFHLFAPLYLDFSWSVCDNIKWSPPSFFLPFRYIFYSFLWYSNFVLKSEVILPWVFSELTIYLNFRFILH